MPLVSEHFVPTPIKATIAPPVSFCGTTTMTPSLSVSLGRTVGMATTVQGWPNVSGMGSVRGEAGSTGVGAAPGVFGLLGVVLGV